MSPVSNAVNEGKLRAEQSNPCPRSPLSHSRISSILAITPTNARDPMFPTCAIRIYHGDSCYALRRHRHLSFVLVCVSLPLFI